jgi:hypothetical protein
MIRPEAEADLKRRFPQLATTQFEVTSEDTTDYNCFAWILGDKGNWISPDLFDENLGLYPWPEGVPRENSVEAWMLALETYGFSRCEDGSLQEGMDKIAIYFNAQSESVHFALQLTSELWTSKIGQWEDISHELEGLTGARYGRVIGFMSRSALRGTGADG